MLLITLSILILASVFTGVGLLFSKGRFFEDSPFRKELSIAGLFSLFWIGWALALAFLQIWHLVYRIDGLAMGFVFGTGAAGWFAARREVGQIARRHNRGALLALAGLAVVPATMLGLHVLFVSPNYDHGLYHMQTVRWIHDYAIVPGLGNLHHRLAFNNASFLYAALLDSAPLAGRGYYLANTLPAFVLILQCAAGFAGLFQEGQRIRGVNVYYALMLPAVLWQVSTAPLPGFSPDLIVFLLQGAAGGELLRLFESGSNREAAGSQTLVVILLAAAGITVKLSFAVFGLGLILAAGGYWILRFRPTGKAALRHLLVWAGVIALLPGVWVARSVLLSGYPLFPSAALGFNVPWRIPEALVTPIAPVIRTWARTANHTIEDTAGLAWLRAWWGVFPFEEPRRALLLAGAAAFLGFGIWLALRIRGKTKPDFPWGAAALFLVSGVGLAGWFLLGPDYRFSGAVFWILLAAALLAIFELVSAKWQRQNALLLACSLVLGLVFFISPNHFSLHKPGSQLILPVTENALMEQIMDIAPMETRTTSSGLAVHMPVEPRDQCFYFPLPCTRPQDFVPGLGLFDANTMQKGFYTRLKP